MRLSRLTLDNTKVADLSPLRGMPLKYLGVNGTAVSDLTPLEGAPLSRFGCAGSPVLDYSVLTTIPIQRLYCDLWLYEQGQRLLELPSLVTINDLPVEEYSKMAAARREAAAEFAAAVASLPPDEQAAAVRKKMIEINPRFDGGIGYKVTNGKITQATLITPGQPDLTPLRALASLRKLNLTVGAMPADLSPLISLPLEELTIDAAQLPRSYAVLRSIKTLKTINGRAAAEALKMPDDGLKD